MASPLAASSSSEDEEVEKQVEEEQKMKKPKFDPKTSHSSDDDEEKEEEEDESEESDSELATPIASKPKKDALKPSSSADSEPKTPSNDEDDETPPLKPKPIASKLSSNVKKRPLLSHKDSKLKKKKVLDSNEGEQEKEESEKKKKKKKKKKNVIIQRLWSDEDELVLLKGLIERKNNGGVDPLTNLKEFLEPIKKSLQFHEVKQEQLRNKIQRLRKKFVNSFKRAKGDKDPVFSKPHEQLSYTLMKEIWGVGGGNSVDVVDGKDDDDDSVVVVNVKRSSSRIRKSQNAVGTKCYAIPMMDLDGDGDAVRKGDSEQKWRCLIVDELKLYLRRVELVREQTVAILDAHKSSDASEVHE